MNKQSPGTEQRPKTPNSQGTGAPGSQERNRGTHGQMEQTGRQNQPGGSQQQDQPHDSDPGVSQDKDNDRGKSGAQRPD